MRFPSTSWPMRLTLTALVLMLTVPFLMAHHYHPIPAFYQEWTAVLLGLVAMLFLLRREFAEQLELPELALFPLGLLLIAVVQWLLLPSALPARLQLFCLYLIWACLMLILGRQLARSQGLDKLSQWMAAAFLTGALLEALTGGLQLEGSIGLPWIFPHTNGIGVRGNLAQNNSFSNYLWLGITAALYLRSRLWLNRPSASIAIAVLIVFAVLSGSRSTWLYATTLTLLSACAVWRWPASAELRRAFRWSLTALLFAIAFQALASSDLHTQFAAHSGSSAGARLLAGGGSDPMRYALWRTALLTWQEHPWLGAGIGQYTWQFHQHVLELMPLRLAGLPEHAHNLALHLLAEAGIFALLLLIIFGGRWALQLMRQQWTPAHWYFVASLLILGFHSGLEYPLWYAFFLGPAALMAGAVSAQNLPLRQHRLAKPLIVGTLLLGAISLYTLRDDYQTLEDLVNGRYSVNSNTEQQQHLLERLDYLSRSVFSPYLDLLAAANQSESAESLESKLATCDRGLHFSATRAIVFKCAHLQALAGMEIEASLALQRAIAAYPADAEVQLKKWQARATLEPELALLLKSLPATVPSAALR